MNNKFATIALSFTVGAIAGFIVAQFVAIEKDTEDTKVTGDQIKNEMKAQELVTKIKETQVDPAELESPKDDDPTELISSGPAHIAMPGQPGVNYAKVQQIVKENGYTDPEDIQAVIDDPDNAETYEERIERESLEATEVMSEYRKKNKDKIVPITKDEWDDNILDYERFDLYYFTGDDILTDEDGHHVDESEYIGVKPRQFGWMANDEEKIYVRNNPKEKDFQVWKQKCNSTDWWA